MAAISPPWKTGEATIRSQAWEPVRNGSLYRKASPGAISMAFSSQ